MLQLIFRNRWSGPVVFFAPDEHAEDFPRGIVQPERPAGRSRRAVPQYDLGYAWTHLGIYSHLHQWVSTEMEQKKKNNTVELDNKTMSEIR